MKKILLILAVVVCVAVAGSALAVAYNNATSKVGHISADTYIALDWGANNSSTTSLELEEGVPSYYTIDCTVVKSTNAAATGTLTIALQDSNEANKSLDNVTVTLYSDSNYQNAVAGKTQKGEGSITITGLTANATYYAKVSVDDGLTNEQLQAVAGTMTLSLAVVPNA